MNSFTVSPDEFQDHVDEYDGICAKCGEWSFGGCEPDAECYECESCGSKKVYGAEMALMMGMIEFDE